jgi:hypothetical protein
LDANTFIGANTTSLTGTLYFWEHYATNTTHSLVDYQGGYATRTLVGGTPPVAPAGISGLGSSSKIPGRYIPVGQGFFVVGSTAGGTITFNNGQRAFVKEDNASSNTLFKNAVNPTVIADHFNNNANDRFTEDNYTRIRLGYTSKENYHRQVLLGFMEENATSAIDTGYDAVHFEDLPSDMYFLNGSSKLNIVGDGFFNIDNVYPIGVKANAFGEVKFMVDATENLNPEQKIYIHDNVTNTYNDITNDMLTIEVPQGLTENRFSLTFKDGNAPALGNDDFGIENGIKVAFTTANSTLTINNNVVDTTVESVLLFNMLGQQVGTFDVKNQTQTNITLPIKSLSAGTYIVKIRTDKGDTSRKIIIN